MILFLKNIYFTGIYLTTTYLGWNKCKNILWNILKDKIYVHNYYRDHINYEIIKFYLQYYNGRGGVVQMVGERPELNSINWY